MKLELRTDLIGQMSLEKVPQKGVPSKDWKPTDKPNYLVYDTHRDAPPGFAVRVGKLYSVFLVDKMVSGKKMKIPVGVARGKKSGLSPISLDDARRLASELIAKAYKHGANPKKIADQIDASELTMGQVWDRYIYDLTHRAQPIKKNSLDSINKARDKLDDWEDRKVRLITGQEIIERFNKHYFELGHKTAAEAMGRWATAAVNNAIENEVHNAHAEGRPPSLAYNPFTILMSKGKYRNRTQLERDYKAKGIRNPLTISQTVGPFLTSAWKYRAENARAAEYLILDLLWGLRGDECRSIKWKDRLPEDKLMLERWVDLDKKVVFIHDGKNRSDQEFPIGPFALELLKLMKANRSKEVWLFPSKMPSSKMGLVKRKDGKEVLSTEPGRWELPSGVPCERGHYSDPSVALKTVKTLAGIKTVRGHDLRRTFGGACEKLGFSDRQVKRMLGHAIAGGETLGRYTEPEWKDHMARMEKIEKLILKTAPSLYNALRPSSIPEIEDPEDALISPKEPTKRRTKKAKAE